MFKKTVLKNGLTVITSPMKNTRSVTVLILVGAGTKYERKEENGISHFLEHMYFKGTKKREMALDITKEIEGIGGILNAFTSKDFTGYFIKVDYSHLNLALDVVSDIFLNSTFREEEIERERGVILEEMKMYEDTPTDYIGMLWEKLLYGNQPAGWDIIGTRKTVSEIKRNNFLNYIKDYYLGPNTVICISGKFNEKETISLIKSYFSSVKRKNPKNKIKTKENQKKPNTLFFKKDTQQAHIALGVRTYNLFNKKRFATQILSVILGGNMSSRLFQEIREKRGMAYYIYTGADFSPDVGNMATFAGIDYKNIESVVGLILEQYRKLKEKGPSDTELQHAKEYIKGISRISLEDSDNIASFYATQALLEKKIVNPEEKLKAIDRTTKKEIVETARDIFLAKNLNFAVISPKEKKVRKFTI